MIEKNFNIKQRAINETPAMVSFQSQNLFKLPHERRYREGMVAIPATTTKVKEEQNADGSITVDKRARP